MPSEVTDGMIGQLFAALVGFGTLIVLVLKNGKVNLTLFAPSREKAQAAVAAALLESMNESFKANLDEFRRTNDTQRDILSTLNAILALNRELLTVQRDTQKEVYKQSGFMDGARK